MVWKKKKLIMPILFLSFFAYYAISALACTIPVDNLTINNDTILCNGTYNIADTGNGLIILNASNITLECNNTVLNGTSAGIGINITGFDNVTVKNCNISNYNTQIHIDSSKNILIDNSTFNDAQLSNIKLISSNDTTISNSEFFGYNTNSLIDDNNTIAFNGVFENNTAKGYINNLINFTESYNWVIRNNYFYNITYLNAGYTIIIHNNVFNYSANQSYFLGKVKDSTQIYNNTFIDAPSAIDILIATAELANNTFINIETALVNPYDATIYFMGGNTFTNVSAIMNHSADATIYIRKTQVLPQGYYFLNDSGNNGAIIIDASNIELDCNNVLINGGGVGKGIVVNNKTNTTIKNCQLQNYTTDLDVLAVSNDTTIENMNVSSYNITNSTITFTYTTLGMVGFLEAITSNGLNLFDNNPNSIVKILNNTIGVRSDLDNNFNVSANLTFYNTDSLGFSNRYPLLDGVFCPSSICSELSDADTYIFNVTQFSNYSVGDYNPPIINSVALSDNNVKNNTVVTITATLTENNATIYNVTAENINLTNKGSGVWNGTINLISGESPINVIINTALYGQITDNGTNFTVDDIVPVINSTLFSIYNTDGSVTLTWSNDTNPDVAKYNVYRSTSSISAPVNTSILVKANFTDTTWIDNTSKLSSTNYYYVVTAVDAADNENLSALSNIINSTTGSDCTNNYSAWSDWDTCTGGTQTRERTRTCYLSGGTTTGTDSQSCTTTSSGGGSGGVASVSTLSQFSITLSKIEGGIQSKVTIKDEEFAIYEALIRLTKSHENVKWTFTKYDSKPTDTDDPDDDEEIFKYFQIKQNKATEDIDDVTIKFKLSKEWLEANDFHPSYIRMYRFTTRWDELATTYSKGDEINYHFEAQTPGFSYFKIAAVVPEQEEEVVQDAIIENESTQQTTSGEDTNTTQEKISLEELDIKKSKPKKWIFWLSIFGLIIISVTTLVVIKVKKRFLKDELEEIRTTKHHVKHPTKHHVKHHSVKKHTSHGEKNIKINTKLVEYFNSEIEKGVSVHKIKENLQKVGWKNDVINKAYNKYKQDNK